MFATFGKKVGRVEVPGGLDLTCGCTGLYWSKLPVKTKYRGFLPRCSRWGVLLKPLVCRHIQTESEKKGVWLFGPLFHSLIFLSFTPPDEIKPTGHGIFISFFILQTPFFFSVIRQMEWAFKLFLVVKHPFECKSFSIRLSSVREEIKITFLFLLTLPLFI